MLSKDDIIELCTLRKYKSNVLNEYIYAIADYLYKEYEKSENYTRAEAMGLDTKEVVIDNFDVGLQNLGIQSIECLIQGNTNSLKVSVYFNCDLLYTSYNDIRKGLEKYMSDYGITDKQVNEQIEYGLIGTVVLSKVDYLTWKLFGNLPLDISGEETYFVMKGMPADILLDYGDMLAIERKTNQESLFYKLLMKRNPVVYMGKSFRKDFWNFLDVSWHDFDGLRVIMDMSKNEDALVSDYELSYVRLLRDFYCHCHAWEVQFKKRFIAYFYTDTNVKIKDLEVYGYVCKLENYGAYICFNFEVFDELIKRE